MATGSQKVSPSIDLPGAEAPLLDLATLAERVKAIETTPDAPTLHHLATREPTSFHQSTIYYGLGRQKHTPPWRKYGLLAASIGIVFLQCFVATGLSFGVGTSTCSEQSDCSRGSFCDEGLCSGCSEWHKSCCLPNATATCSIDKEQGHNRREMGEKDREGMCNTCVSDKGFETYHDVVREGVHAMFIQDWFALFLASLVISFAVFAEIRDGLLTEIALREISKRREVPRGWSFAIHGLNFARYFILFPKILFSVMMLVHENGGRVRDICLNTVAVLFLLEVDNLAFLHGLGERTRMEAEEHAGAHEHVTELDLQSMDAVKLVCVLTIPCAVIGGVCGAYARNLADGETDNVCFMLAPLPSMLVVFVQRVKANGRRGACGGLGWAVVGYVAGLGWDALFYQMIYLQATGEGAKYVR
jgi:hypothetical protein